MKTVDLEENNSSSSLSIKNTTDIYGISDVEKIDMHKKSTLKMWTIYPLFTVITLGILPFISIWVISLRLFLWYTKIDNDVS
jgi:hypothetical protein